MKHPSEYTTAPLLGMHVMAVDVGTTITDERTGEQVTIDDETCATEGSVIFCTQKTYDAIKASVKERLQ